LRDIRKVIVGRDDCGRGEGEDESSGLHGRRGSSRRRREEEREKERGSQIKTNDGRDKKKGGRVGEGRKGRKGRKRRKGRKEETTEERQKDKRQEEIKDDSP